MHFTVEWIERPWLLLFNLEGNFTLTDYEAFTIFRLRYLSKVRKLIYLIYDWSGIDPNLPPKIIIEMTRVPSYAQLHIGVMATVSNQAMLDFVASPYGQREMKHNGQTAIQAFATRQEAEHFCRTKAALDREAETTFTRRQPPT